MDSQLSLSIIEIIVLMLGAIVLGITVHFFISSRRSLKAHSPVALQQAARELEDWKLRYFNEIERRDHELEELKKRLTESEENNNINAIEAEENRKQNKKLLAELEALRAVSPAPAEKPGYMDQLSLARSSLKEYNEKINDPKNYRITLTDGSIFQTNNDLIYLGKTNDYYFLFDNVGNKSIILPSKEVKSQQVYLK